MAVAKHLESRTELTDLCIRSLFSRVCHPELTDPYVLVYLGADPGCNKGGAQNVFRSAGYFDEFCAEILTPEYCDWSREA
jgi:hypothetical protein